MRSILQTSGNRASLASDIQKLSLLRWKDDMASRIHNCIVCAYQSNVATIQQALQAMLLRPEEFGIG